MGILIPPSHGRTRVLMQGNQPKTNATRSLPPEVAFEQTWGHIKQVNPSRRAFLKSTLSAAALLATGNVFAQEVNKQVPIAPPALPPMTLEEKREFAKLLKGFEKKSIQYFLENRHPRTGLVLDRAVNKDVLTVVQQLPENPKVRKEMASMAATGYSFSAIVLAVENGMLRREIAHKMVEDTLDFVASHTPAIQRGWLAHFVHNETGQTYGKTEISSIDTALFYLGAFAAAEYFGGKLQGKVNTMFNKIDFKMMLTNNGEEKDKLVFSHGFHVAKDKGKQFRHFITANYGAYSEGLLVPLLALGSKNNDKVFERAWLEGWNREKVWKYNGVKNYDKHPLFTFYYALGYLNLKDKADGKGENFWEASKEAIDTQIRYCQDKGYPPGWFGITACDGPNGYNAYAPEHRQAHFPEKGRNVFKRFFLQAVGGMLPDQTIAPPAIFASLPFVDTFIYRKSLPNIVKEELDQFKYGLCCAFDPSTGWKATDALGIDVGSTLLMMNAYQAQLENKEGIIHRLMDRNAIMQRALKRAGFHPEPQAVRGNNVKAPGVIPSTGSGLPVMR
jgi:hypothetical protein